MQPKPTKPIFDLNSVSCPKAETNVPAFVEALFDDYIVRRSIKRVGEFIDKKAEKPDTRIELNCLFSKKLMQEGGFKHCNELLTDAIAKYPHSEKVIQEMAKLKYLSNKYDEALEYYHKALSITKTNKKEYTYKISVNLMHSGKYTEAINKFN